MEYHTVYKRPEGETTQWEDLQRKFGNLPPKEAVQKPEAFVPAQDRSKDRQLLDNDDDIDALENAEDDFADDPFLEAYRQERLKQLREAAQRTKFGSVGSISRDEFVSQVTEDSRTSWVVVLLYQERVLGCQVVGACLKELAAQYNYVKFLKIASTECIPNYPDENLPTLLVYRDGQCKRTIVGTRSLGDIRISPESVAAGLNDVGPICTGQNAGQGAGGNTTLRAHMREYRMPSMCQDRPAGKGAIKRAQSMREDS